MSSSQKTESHNCSTPHGSLRTESRPGSSHSGPALKEDSKVHTQHPTLSHSGNSKLLPLKTNSPLTDSHPEAKKHHRPPFNVKRLESGYPTGSVAFDKPGHIIPHQYFGFHYQNADNSISHHPLNWTNLNKHPGPEKRRLIIARTNYLSQSTFSYHPRPSREIMRLINVAKVDKRYSMKKPEKPLRMPLS